MPDILEHLDEEQMLTDKEVFTRIWTEPRLVFRFIIHHQYEKYLTVLIVLAGIAKAFDRAASANQGDRLSLFTIIMLCIVLGGIFAWVSYYIYASLIKWTGGWMSGQADTRSIMRVLGYAMIPSVAGMILLVPQVLVFGHEIFKSNGDVSSSGPVFLYLFYGLILIELALSVWSIVLTVIGLAELQNFSIGKAFLNFILPVLIIFIPIMVIVMLTQL